MVDLLQRKEFSIGGIWGDDEGSFYEKFLKFEEGATVDLFH